MGTQHIIELNGKRYDARTGKLADINPPAKKHLNQSKQHTSQSTRKATGLNIDGIAKAHPPRKVIGTALPHHKAQKSNTLMRTVVPKPKPVHKDIVHKKQAPAHSGVTKTHTRPAEARLEIAKKTPRSQAIQKFNTLATPTTLSASASTAQTAALSTSPVASQTANPFHNALSSAKAHEQPKLKKPRTHSLAKRLHLNPKTLNAAAFSLGLALLVGFFAYQSLPNISMQMASARAQVNGTLPSYKPAGFRLNGRIQYEPGKIVVGYQSNSDDRNFQITQAASEWDSQSLLENFVAAKPQYQTVQEKGKTIYIYDTNNATWVDGGVWYKIEGESKLNGQQLRDLALSL